MTLVPLDSAQWFQTTKRLTTAGFPSLKADVSSTAPPGCQRGNGSKKGSFRLRSKGLDAKKKQVTSEVRNTEGEGTRYRSPRLRAAASTSAASARRSDTFLETQASQDFPFAVSSPLKAIEAM